MSHCSRLSLRRSFLTAAGAAAMTLALCGCGGGKDSPDALSGEFGGLWNAQYNISIDDCQLVESGVLGFTDSQTITQEDDTIILESAIGQLSDPFLGTVEADRSFTASTSFSGDFYGDGTLCNLTQTVAYNPRTDDEAASTFQRDMSCNDGFTCTTLALGVSKRASIIK